jgi:hypothetical protein
VASVTNLVLIIHLHKSVPVLQSYILEPVAVSSSIALTYFNHTRERRSSSILLLFWPIYLICLAVWARSVVTRDFDYDRSLLFLKGGVGLLGLASFVLECIGPEMGIPKDAHENPILTANIFSLWVRVAHIMLLLPNMRPVFRIYDPAHAQGSVTIVRIHSGH